MRTWQYFLQGSCDCPQRPSFLMCHLHPRGARGWKLERETEAGVLQMGGERRRPGKLALLSQAGSARILEDRWWQQQGACRWSRWGTGPPGVCVELP